MASILVASRRGGKTHALVEFMRVNPEAIMICATDAIAQMTADQFADLDLARSRFIGPSPQRLKGLDPSHVLVDNAELVLAELLGHHVTSMSMTPEPLPVD